MRRAEEVERQRKFEKQTVDNDKLTDSHGRRTNVLYGPQNNGNEGDGEDAVLAKVQKAEGALCLDVRVTVLFLILCVLFLSCSSLSKYLTVSKLSRESTASEVAFASA